MLKGDEFCWGFLVYPTSYLGRMMAKATARKGTGGAAHEGVWVQLGGGYYRSGASVGMSYAMWCGFGTNRTPHDTSCIIVHIILKDLPT